MMNRPDKWWLKDELLNNKFKIKKTDLNDVVTCKYLLNRLFIEIKGGKITKPREIEFILGVAHYVEEHNNITNNQAYFINKTFKKYNLDE